MSDDLINMLLQHGKVEAQNSQKLKLSFNREGKVSLYDDEKLVVSNFDIVENQRGPVKVSSYLVLLNENNLHDLKEVLQ